MSNAPFPINPILSAVSLAYKNKRLIADDVLPRVSVAKQEFKYRKYALADGFTIPNTMVGRTSQPNQVEYGFTEVGDETRDYALDDPIPYADELNAPAGYDPAARASEVLSDLIALDREVRTAGLVFDYDSYAAANKTTLTGSDQWSDFTNSDPVGAIVAALNSVVMRPNIAVFGRDTWTALCRHPSIVQAFHGNMGASGIATTDFVARLFELDHVLIGDSWVNISKRGQAPKLARAWGKHAAFLHVDPTADTQYGTTFGFTAQWGDRVAGSIPDKDIGMRGGHVVRVGESVRELVIAPDLGYFFQDAVA